jgi:tagatose kinase
LKKVLVIGEILVEIMADTNGPGFLEPQPLTGPFPSGAPAIFADQMAKMGQPVAIISAVGKDDFGRLNLNRLNADGVDISAVFVDNDRPTGSAFVRYRIDGSRDFVFNIRHSASGFVHENDSTKRLFQTADHVHVMGSSLSSADFIALNLKAAETVKARNGTVSFDPNLRKEILDTPGMREAMNRFVALTDLSLPSDQELTLLTESRDDDSASAELLDRGVKGIVHKLGRKGARFTDHKGSLFVPAFQIDETDPTGAGDCFGGAFTTLWLRGADPGEALRYAAAAGAMAVTRRGPMEGTSKLTDLVTFLTNHEGVS